MANVEGTANGLFTAQGALTSRVTALDGGSSGWFTSSSLVSIATLANNTASNLNTNLVPRVDKLDGNVAWHFGTSLVQLHNNLSTANAGLTNRLAVIDEGNSSWYGTVSLIDRVSAAETSLAASQVYGFDPRRMIVIHVGNIGGTQSTTVWTNLTTCLCPLDGFFVSARRIGSTGGTASRTIVEVNYNDPGFPIYPVITMKNNTGTANSDA